MSETKDSPTPDAGTAQAAMASIRETAKWAVAAFAGVGAVLAAGTQLSSLGSVQDPLRVGSAMLLALLGLLAVMFAIWRTVDVLMPTRLALSELGRLEETSPTKGLGKYLHEHPELRQEQAASVRSLGEKLQAALVARDTAYDIAERPGATGEQKATANAKDMEAIYLSAVVQNLLTEVGVARLSMEIGRWRRDATLAVVVAGAALVYFAWAANPPKAAASAISLAGADLSRANLVGATLEGVDLRGANLSEANLRGVKLEGAQLDGVIWTHATCPDGRTAEEEGGACRP